LRWWIIALHSVVILIAVVWGLAERAMYGLRCFYTPPIGGSNCKFLLGWQTFAEAFSMGIASLYGV
jgi:hypothetical protein